MPYRVRALSEWGDADGAPLSLAFHPPHLLSLAEESLTQQQQHHEAVVGGLSSEKRRCRWEIARPYCVRLWGVSPPLL